MNINDFLAILVFLVAVVTPGPANIAISYIALHHGRTAALRFALGVICGSFTWAISMMITIDYVATQYNNSLVYLNILSGAYFLLLSYRTLQTSSTKTQTQLGTAQLFISGLLLHLTNPKAFVAWSSVFTIAVNARASLLMTLIGCVILAVIVFSGYAILFSRDSLRAYYGKNERIISRVVSIFFFGLALYMLSHAILES